jgi:hypothetical protein
MIKITRVGVRTPIQEEVYDLSRPRKVQGRLAVTTSLMHTRGLLTQNAFEEIGTIQIRGAARVWDGTPFHQSLGHRPLGSMQSMESPGPPLTSPIGIRSQVKKEIHHLAVALTSEVHDGRCIEREHRRVQQPSSLCTFRKNLTDGNKVTAVEGTPKLLMKW